MRTAGSGAGADGPVVVHGTLDDNFGGVEDVAAEEVDDVVAPRLGIPA